MALLRKDLRIGFLAGGLLLALAVGYALILTFSGPDAPAEVALADLNLPVADPPAGIDPSAPPGSSGAQPAGPAGQPETSGAFPQLANAEPAASEWSVYGVNGQPPHITETPTPGTALVDDSTPNLNDVEVTELPDDAGTGQPPFSGAGAPAGGGSPAPAGQPAIQTHVVESGESLSSIAEKYYGDPNLFTILQKANPSVDSRLLKVGQKLRIPERAAAEPEPAADAGAAEQAADDPTHHTVAPGETLSLIASRRLGRATLWDEIYRLNRDLIGPDPANLKVGMKLQLPSK